MDDARTDRLADAGDLGELREQTVDQGAGRVAGTRVHDEAGRLVDDDHVVVDVDDPELTVGSAAGGSMTGRAAGSMSIPLSLGEAHLAGPAHDAVDRRTTGRDHHRCVGAADVGDQRDDPVEALPVEGGRNDLGDHDDDA